MAAAKMGRKTKRARGLSRGDAIMMGGPFDLNDSFSGHADQIDQAFAELAIELQGCGTRFSL
jgi:hypothetical protein